MVKFKIEDVEEKYKPEAIKDRRQLTFYKLTRDRQIHMYHLHKDRTKKEKKSVKGITVAIGPHWLQTLTCPQTVALDTLKSCMYQDSLEGRPIRTVKIMKDLGLYPIPNNADLMECINQGKGDPKEMLARLFFNTYSHEVSSKRAHYPLNAKLMLSGILHLGIDELIDLLRKRFQSDEKPPSPKKEKPKPPPPSESPYLKKQTAYLYLPPVKKPPGPAPLPSLDKIFNDPLEDEALQTKTDPARPGALPSSDKQKQTDTGTRQYNEPFEESKAPSAVDSSKASRKQTVSKKQVTKSKRTVPESYCDKMTGYNPIRPYSSVTEIPEVKSSKGKSRKQKAGASAEVADEPLPPLKKPEPPCIALANAPFTINGVSVINNKAYYNLAQVSILPPEGIMIHGGFAYADGKLVHLNLGYKGKTPAPIPDRCDCFKKYLNVALEYVKSTKCKCGHYYDYGNEGTFPPTDLPFFQKPTPNFPYQFNYDTIFDLDEKRLLVRKDFKRFWETDSVILMDDPNYLKPMKKKKSRRPSNADKLTTMDYLKGALRIEAQSNITAKLPDVHLVPELKEWMRNRIHGPVTPEEKRTALTQSSAEWQIMLRLAQKGFGHMIPPKSDVFSGDTTWAHKQQLKNAFVEFTEDYKVQVFQSHANIINMLWATMCQGKFPKDILFVHGVFLQGIALYASV